MLWSSCSRWYEFEGKGKYVPEKIFQNLIMFATANHFYVFLIIPAISSNSQQCNENRFEPLDDINHISNCGDQLVSENIAKSLTIHTFESVLNPTTSYFPATLE